MPDSGVLVFVLHLKKLHILWAPIYFPALLAALLLTPYEPVGAALLTGRVLRVTDGDTLTLLGPGNAQYEVRLLGADAPEPGQPYAEAARRHLLAMACGRFAVVEYTACDRQGRILGKVSVAKRDIGLAQIGAGLAWHDKRAHARQLHRDRELYAKAEHRARQAKQGLWWGPYPIAPWDWRQPNHLRESWGATALPQDVPCGKP